ncbi:DUF2489 domain-containing protein [Thalassolituus sp.]|uniref:DUF2489 domain-containing protein n=1 Tax=Thalassolituus sp. TaxID=2030822 RepID=UPI0035171E5A|nr:MAG: hypothetical protein CSH36_12995 [Thalassolituus sp.]
MPTLHLILLIAAAIVILALAGYALHLTRQVKKMQAEQRAEEAEAELQLRKYQEGLVQDIRFIASSVVQEQCDITEGVLRIQYLLNGLDPAVWEMQELKTVRDHYEATRTMPILEAYKALTPKQQFAIDRERLRLEDQNKASVTREFRWLAAYSFPQVTLLQ